MMHIASSNDIHRQGKRLIRLFVDFRQAYDRVPTSRLLWKLEQRAAPIFIRSLILSLFAGCQTQIAVNGRLTDPVNLERGILQGSILAPFLFNVYIDDLAERLNLLQLDGGVSALLLADDLQTLAREERDILAQCDIISAWTEENGMEVNNSKCGVMGSSAVFEISGRPVPHVQRYTYLGAPHAITGIRFQEHIDRYASKAERTLSFMLRFRDQWSENVKLGLYKAFVRSRLEYCLPLIHALPPHHPARAPIFERLESIQDQAMKWIIPFSSSVARTRHVLGIPRMDDRAHGLAVTFVEHVRKARLDHPMRDILQHYATQPVTPDSVISPRVQNLPLHHELRRRATMEGSSLVTEVKRWYVDQLDKASAWEKIVLDRRCRRDLHGPDSCIRISQDFLRNRALQWRCNSFLCHFRCPSCNRRMTRGCIPRCLGRHFPDISTDETRRRTIYTIFDFYLNRSRYLEFNWWIDALLELVSPVAPSPPAGT
jgi:hypothetical protein